MESPEVPLWTWLLIGPGFQLSIYVLWNLDKAKASIFVPSLVSNSSRLKGHGNSCFRGGSSFRSPLGRGGGRVTTLLGHGHSAAPLEESWSVYPLKSAQNCARAEEGAQPECPFGDLVQWLSPGAIVRLWLLACLLSCSPTPPDLRWIECSQDGSKDSPSSAPKAAAARGRSKAETLSPSAVSGERSKARAHTHAAGLRESWRGFFTMEKLF